MRLDSILVVFAGVRLYLLERQGVGSLFQAAGRFPDT
jgi:hypothetical protein